jgi:hypothetical protein
MPVESMDGTADGASEGGFLIEGDLEGSGVGDGQKSCTLQLVDAQQY